MLDVLLDAFIDSLKTFGIVFIIYLVMSIVEHKLSKKMTLNSKLSPAFTLVISNLFSNTILGYTASYSSSNSNLIHNVNAIKILKINFFIVQFIPFIFAGRRGRRPLHCMVSFY